MEMLTGSPPALQEAAPAAEQLMAAIREREFFLLYQPMASCTTGHIIGLEACLRWKHEGALIAPQTFQPLLERTGLAIPVGAWAIEEACLQAKGWASTGARQASVAINLSARQFMDPGLEDVVNRALSASGLAPHLLELELAESLLNGDPDSTCGKLAALRKLGVRLIADDAGSGNFSLAHLRRMPLDGIKPGTPFANGAGPRRDEGKVMGALVDLAHALNLRLVAQGVETGAQLDMLISSQCDAVQGPYFSAPVSAGAAQALMREGHGLPPQVLVANKGPGTLLLVDDEENILASLKRMLRRTPYRVLTANSAAAGLRLLADHHVDVVVSDQRMPAMTGVEFLRQVKDIHPHTVRMVLSGYTDLQSVTDAINEGAIYKFLTKPWDDDHLRANIEEAFRRKEIGDENRRLNRELSVTNERLAEVNSELCSLLQDDARQAERDESLLLVLQEALHQLPMPLLGLDEDGLLALSNHAADALLGGGRSLIGCQAVDILPADLLAWLAECSREDRSFVAQGRSWIATTRPMGAGSASRGRLLYLRARERS